MHAAVCEGFGQNFVEQGLIALWELWESVFLTFFQSSIFLRLFAGLSWLGLGIPRVSFLLGPLVMVDLLPGQGHRRRSHFMLASVRSSIKLMVVFCIARIDLCWLFLHKQLWRMWTIWPHMH